MKILLKGYYGFGNLGDDLLLLVMYRILMISFKDSEIFIFSNASKNNKDFIFKEDYNLYIKKLLESDSIKIIDWKYEGHFDIVIDGGGGIYFDYSRANILQQTINKSVALFSPNTIFRYEKVLRSLLKKKSNITFTKRYAIGVNIGPFSTKSKRFLYLYSLLGSVNAFLVRDRESIEYLTRFRHNGFYKKIPDIVFSKTFLPELEQKKAGNKIQTIGIIVMNWKGKDQNYLETLKIFVTQREREGYECHIFSFSELDDDILDNGLMGSISYWRPNEMTLSLYLKYLAEVDLIISMRFHGLVIAAAMGVPSMGIGINTKIIDFSQQASDCCGLVNEINMLDNLEEVFGRCVSNYKNMVKNAKKKSDAFRNEEYKVIDFIENNIKRNLDE